MPGRIGRGHTGRGYPRDKPKYLNNPAPHLPFSNTRSLANNKFAILDNQSKSNFHRLTLSDGSSFLSPHSSVEDFLNSLSPPKHASSNLINFPDRYLSIGTSNAKSPCSSPTNVESINDWIIYSPKQKFKRNKKRFNKVCKKHPNDVTTCKHFQKVFQLSHLIPESISSTHLIMPNTPKSPMKTRSKSVTKSKTLKPKQPVSSPSKIRNTIAYNTSTSVIKTTSISDLKAFLIEWHTNQSSSLTPETITNMQDNLIQQECIKVRNALRDQHNAIVKEAPAGKHEIIVTPLTDNETILGLSDRDLEKQLVLLSNQRGLPLTPEQLSNMERDSREAELMDYRDELYDALTTMNSKSAVISQDEPQPPTKNGWTNVKQTDAPNESDDEDSSVESETNPLTTQPSTSSSDTTIIETDPEDSHSVMSNSTTPSGYDIHDEQDDQDKDSITITESNNEMECDDNSKDGNEQDPLLDELPHHNNTTSKPIDVNNKSTKPIPNYQHGIQASNHENDQQASTTKDNCTFTQSNPTVPQDDPNEQPVFNENPGSPTKKPRTEQPLSSPMPRGRVSSQQDHDHVIGRLGHSVTNLRGWNMEEATAISGDPNQDKINVKAVTTSTITMRVALRMLKGKHAPSFIRKFVKILRQIDPTAQVLPFDRTNNSYNDIITHEEQIPTDEETIQTWIRGISIDRVGRLELSIRITLSINEYAFRGIIFDWAKKHRHFITIDNISADKVFPLGWFYKLHCTHINRDGFKQWLDQQDTTGTLKDNYKLYARHVSQDVPGSTERKLAEVIGIVGALDYKDELIKFFTQTVRWNGTYKQARFISFRLNKEFTKYHLVAAIESHNEYTKKLWTKTILVDQYDKIIAEKKTGIHTNFHHWLAKCTVNGGSTQLFEGIEVSKPNFVKMIYASDLNDKVLTTINNLHKYMKNFFGTKVTNDILGNEETYSKTISAATSEASYMSTLAQQFSANPQELDDEPYVPVIRQKNTKAWFGPNPLLQYDPSIEDSPSPGKSSTTKPDVVPQDDVTTTPPKTLETLVKEAVSDSMKKLETSIKSVETAANTRMTTISNELNSKTIAVDNKSRNRAKRQRDQVMKALTAITSHLGVNYNPENEDEYSSGEDE